MGDQIHDIAEVDATRMQMIAAMVQRELAAQSKMSGLLTDLSGFAEPGLKSISFPKLGSFEVQKLGQNQRADAQILPATDDELLLDQHASVQFIMKKRASLQSRLNYEAELIRRATSAHSRQFDIDVVEDLVSNAAAANDVSYVPASIEDNIKEAVEKLDAAHAPESDRFLIFRAKQKRLLLGVDNFVQADRYGSNIPLVTGELGQAYGLRFVMLQHQTDSYVDDVMVAFHKEAVGYGFQMDADVDEQKAIEYGAGSKRMAVDQLYGTKTMQGGVLASVIKV